MRSNLLPQIPSNFQSVHPKNLSTIITIKKSPNQLEKNYFPDKKEFLTFMDIFAKRKKKVEIKILYMNFYNSLFSLSLILEDFLFFFACCCPIENCFAEKLLLQKIKLKNNLLDFLR